MRLYLSSFRVGNRPDALVRLLDGGRETALILNADDYKSPPDRVASLRREIDELRAIGLVPTEVDLREYFGRAQDVKAALHGFQAVYVRGGNVFALRRAMRLSGADEALTEMLRADALVYAGYSAGSCVLGPTLRGIEGHVDDPSFIPGGYPPGEPVWEGLGLLPFAIAPHYKSDHPEAGEILRTVDYFIDHHIPFIALRDGQALLIDGDTTKVVG